MKKLFFAWLLTGWLTVGLAQERTIDFPDVPGYVTLVTDLHIHSIFSDGSVWPDIRIQEALLDGLDAIAVTEHLEYQPHKKDLPHPDRNRAYELALEYAKGKDLLVIPGVEITRNMPPGHSNAIFVQDANKFLIEDPLEVFREAKKQGAYVFWNHPNWTAQRSDGVATLTDLHRQLLKEKLLHGIEVVNELTFSDEAMALAKEHQLAMLGTSDIHGLIDWLFEVPEGGHRPVTLVFAKERSLEGIKEGLFARRTVIWNKNNLIGEEAVLQPLIQASIQVDSASYGGKSEVLTVQLKNSSDARYVLRNQSGYTLHTTTDLVELAPQSITEIQVKTLQRMEQVELKFEVLNALIAPNQHPQLKISVEVGS